MWFLKAIIPKRTHEPLRPVEALEIDGDRNGEFFIVLYQAADLRRYSISIPMCEFTKLTVICSDDDFRSEINCEEACQLARSLRELARTGKLNQSALTESCLNSLQSAGTYAQPGAPADRLRRPLS